MISKYKPIRSRQLEYFEEFLLIERHHQKIAMLLSAAIPIKRSESRALLI
jgi:hypothetical protein